jgi:hypothetical protein
MPFLRSILFDKLQVALSLVWGFYLLSAFHWASCYRDPSLGMNWILLLLKDVEFIKVNYYPKTFILSYLFALRFNLDTVACYHPKWLWFTASSFPDTFIGKPTLMLSWVSDSFFYSLASSCPSICLFTSSISKEIHFELLRMGRDKLIEWNFYLLKMIFFIIFYEATFFDMKFAIIWLSTENTFLSKQLNHWSSIFSHFKSWVQSKTSFSFDVNIFPRSGMNL